MLCRRDEGAVGVVVCEVDVCWCLDDGVVPAIVDAQCDQVDLFTCYEPVLFLDVPREGRAEVAAVGFGEDAEIAGFVVGKCGVEGLDEVPDVWRRGVGVDGGAVTHGEADFGGLVDVEHVDVVVPAEGVVDRLGVLRAELEFAGTVLLEKADH